MNHLEDFRAMLEGYQAIIEVYFRECTYLQQPNLTQFCRGFAPRWDILPNWKEMTLVAFGDGRWFLSIYKQQIISKCCKLYIYIYIHNVGGFNPSEKY